MPTTLKVGQVIPKAPLGVLGGFIENKLREYVEPERAGTPKGEPVGLSRKKFHAVLLNLTSIDLLKTAIHVGVSYGVIRKWRTEDVFYKRFRTLADEFINGCFAEAADASLRLLIRPDGTIEPGPGLDKEVIRETIGTQRMPGFADSRFYSRELVLLILAKWSKAIPAVAEAGKGYFRQVLPWVRPLDCLLRQEAVCKSDVEKHRRGLIRKLADLQRCAIVNPATEEPLMIVDMIAELIIEVSKD